MNLIAIVTSAIAVTALAGLMLFAIRSHRRQGWVRAELQRAALADPITGLGNRRALIEDIDRRLEASGGRPLVLVLLQLEGLQAYTRAFGDLAGDALLQRLARRLADSSAGASATAYRWTGASFGVLAPIGRAGAAALVTASTASVAQSGEGFQIEPFYGVALLPEEAADGASALRLADRRLSAQAEAHNVRASTQLRQVVLERLRRDHISPLLGPLQMADLVRGIAVQVGLEDQDTETTVVATELRDVGNLAIPAEILAKPGPLDEREWLFIQRHTEIGQRVVELVLPAANVGEVIRSSHERYDGGGYPDGLAGNGIPLQARIVAVCGAFEAMLRDRADRPALNLTAALNELRAGAGTQFDPAVVDALEAVLERDQLKPSPEDLGPGVPQLAAA